VELVGRLILALVLAGSVAGKLAKPRQAIAAMATHGFRHAFTRRLAFAFVVAAEAALAVGVALGSDEAAYAAAALMALFALTLGGEMLRGKAGEPCGCFGGDSEVGWPAIGRNVVLAAAFAAVPSLPNSLSTGLALGFVAALAACAALAVAVRRRLEALGV
jgi:methylamine utilization protein MauE